MTKVEFFSGKRAVTNICLFRRHKDKEHLYCTVEEEWRENFADSTICGIPMKLSLKRTIGVSASERQELEATISSSLGVKSVAEVSSAIKGSLGQEIRLEEVLEEAKELTLTTPKCGRFTLQIFQLHRLYNLEYSDDRFFRRKKYSRTLVERLSRWWQVPDVIQSIPECRCVEQPEKGPGGILRRIGIAFNEFGLSVDCVQTAASVSLPALDLSFPDKRVEDLIGQEVVVSGAAIPAYMFFLAGESGEVRELKGVFVSSEPAASSSPQAEEHVTKESLVRRLAGLAVIAGIGVVAGFLGRRSTPQAKSSSQVPADTATRDQPMRKATIYPSTVEKHGENKGPAAHV